MKLELKHIAPYLPYGLKVKTDNWIEKVGGIESIDFSTSEIRLKLIIKKEDGIVTSWTPQLKHCKPILRPLSDLKQIEKEIQEIDSYWYVEEFLTQKSRIDKIYPQHVIEFIPYAIMQVLLKNHFDVFGLIDKGLAIDINTINK